jgi:hypothetical protein
MRRQGWLAHTHTHACAHPAPPPPARPQVLKGERDALLKLIQSMRREYEAVQAARLSQEDEMRSMKDRMLLGVSRGTGDGARGPAMCRRCC